MAHRNHQFGWQDWAVCHKEHVPSYIFFPDERRNPGFALDPEFEGKTYKDFCNRCPVKSLCTQFADLHDLQGIWGGKTENERNEFSTFEDREEIREHKRGNGDYWPLYGHS